MIKQIVVSILLTVVFLTTTQLVQAAAYDDGYADGWNDFIDGFSGEDVSCESTAIEEDVYCDEYITGYEDGRDAAAQSP